MPNDLAWLERLEEQIPKPPPAGAACTQTIAEKLGMELRIARAHMDQLVKDGQMHTMLYKGRRYYWPADDQD